MSPSTHERPAPRSPTALERSGRRTGPLATVRDLLAVDSLRLRLVAGEAGIDRPIRWAHSIELLDPRPYLRGGELVLTMGAMLTDGDMCRRFVRAVLERDASGLGFGCGNFHPESPADLREACEAAGLPLVEVPYEVPFMAITEEIAERMAARRGERDRRALRREARLLDIVAEGRGLDGLARAIARELRSTVVIADVHGSLEAIAGPESVSMNAPAIIAAALAEARPGDRRASSRDGLVACDLVAVLHQKRKIGWLGWLRPGVLRPGADAGSDALEILHEVAPIVSIALATRVQERAGDRRAIGRLLDIVRSGIADPVVLAERIAEARLDDARLVASVWGPEAAEQLRRGLPRSVVGETGGRCYVLTDDPARLLEFAREHVLACGVGSVVSLAELPRGLVEAEGAYSIAAAGRGVATWRDLASLSTLLGQQPADRLAAFANQLVVPLIEYDAQHGSELVATLRAFIEQGGAVEGTARLRHVHPNTLRHRLRRVRVLTGRDPFTFLDRVAFYVGFWAWDTQHGRTAQEQGLNVVVPDD